MACCARANMVLSVIESTFVTSRASRLRLSSSIDTRLRSDSFVQLVRVKRSTRLHDERGCRVPSLTSLPKVERFNLLIKLL